MNKNENTAAINFSENQLSQGAMDESTMTTASSRNTRKWCRRQIIVIGVISLLVHFATSTSISLNASLLRDVILKCCSLVAAIGATLAAPHFLGAIGPKFTIATGILLQTPFTIANFYPLWSVILPTAFLSGFGSAICCAAILVSVVQIAHVYISSSQMSNDRRKPTAVARCFTLWAFLHYAYLILSHGFLYTMKVHMFGNGLEQKNDKMKHLGPDRHCGLGYCPMNSSYKWYDETNNEIMIENDTHLRFQACSGSLVSILLALFIVFLVVEDYPELYPNKPITTSSSIPIAMAHFKTSQQIFLTPIGLFYGMQWIYLTQHYGRSYIYCIWSTDYVHIFAILVGGVSMAFSALCSWLIKIFEPSQMILGTAIVHMGVFIMLLIEPTSFQEPLFVGTLACLWSICNCAWNIFILCAYAAMDNPVAALTTWVTMINVGHLAALFYGNVLCTNMVINVLICVLTLGIAGYFAFCSDRSTVAATGSSTPKHRSTQQLVDDYDVMASRQIDNLTHTTSIPPLVSHSMQFDSMSSLDRRISKSKCQVGVGFSETRSTTSKNFDRFRTQSSVHKSKIASKGSQQHVVADVHGFASTAASVPVMSSHTRHRRIRKAPNKHFDRRVNEISSVEIIRPY